MNLVGLTWWQALLLMPGMRFMDWLARNHPDIVIRHGFGFTVESYVFWSAVISSFFWALLITLLAVIGRWALRRARGRG